MRNVVSSKYTKEVLQPIVQASANMYDVLRALGLRLAGGNWCYVNKRIMGLGIDTSHFRRPAPRLQTQKLDWKQVLVYDRRGGCRESQHVLKRSLLASGREERCAICDLGPAWQGKKLSLQIDHKDGDFLNNVPENLRFLCPNCHTQTGTFGSNKLNAVRSRCRIKRVCACGGSISPKAKVCSRCAKAKPSRTKIAWPEPHEIRQMVWANPVTTVAAQLGVSPVSITKRCKRFGIETPGPGYWMKTDRG